jgi:hypothetical protein
MLAPLQLRKPGQVQEADPLPLELLLVLLLVPNKGAVVVPAAVLQQTQHLCLAV